MGWTRSRHTLTGSAALATAIIALAVPARAQVVFNSITNGRITASEGISGTVNNTNGAGRLGVFANGTPLVPLMTPVLNPIQQSYITVRIDGGHPANSTDPDTQTQAGWDLIYGDVGTFGKTNEGAWTQPPIVIGGALYSSWHTTPGGNAKFPIPRIQVELTITLVGDMARYQFVITSFEQGLHTVGIRFAQDYEGPGGQDAPIFTPSLGQICNETDLIGGQIPQNWQVGSTAAGTVGADLIPVNAGGNDPTAPDRLVFTQISHLTPNLWDVVNTGASLCGPTGGDAGAGVFFNPQSVSQSGGARVITTYLGLKQSSADYSPPFIASVTGPPTLNYDPTKPAGQQITPNPFTITAFVQNTSQIPLSISATLNTLPAGLQIDPASPPSPPAQTVAPGGSTTFSWLVHPTGAAGGRLTYSVAFTSSPGGQGKVISRDIDIPSIPVQTLPGGLSMVSFPFVFDDPRPAAALGLNDFDFQLVRWNTEKERYETVTSIIAGAGYWLNLAAQKTVTLVGSHPVNTNGTQYQWALSVDPNTHQGWNQIGDPFPLRVRFADIMVLDTNQGDIDYFKPIPVAQAADANHQWILPTLYSYDPNQHQYVFDDNFGTDLIPFQGYWVKALKPNITLLYSQPTLRAASATRIAQPSATPNTSDNWRLRLIASAGGSTDGYNFLGVAPNAKDGWDRTDVEKPPAVQGQVSLGFVHPDWGPTRAGTYARDLQAATGGRKVWNVVVNTAKPNTDITLSWPEVGSVPRGYELYVSDTATGVRKAMRQTSSIRLNSGDSGSRSVQIIAEPRLRGALTIQALNVMAHQRGATSGATISFTTSQDANIQVRVLKSTGEVVRSLVTRAVPSGSANMVWDYRDNRGVSIPTGAYLVEVKATTDDGQSARLVTPHVVVR